MRFLPEEMLTPSGIRPKGAGTAMAVGLSALVCGRGHFSIGRYPMLLLLQGCALLIAYGFMLFGICNPELVISKILQILFYLPFRLRCTNIPNSESIE